LNAVIFLKETLELWGVAGSVEAGEAPLVAMIRSESGTMLWIERPPRDEAQFRWAVRWRRAGDTPGSPREVRPRMCGSLVGVLGAMRDALNVDRGTPLRIAPAPE
jgi:hypothetical protein